MIHLVTFILMRISRINCSLKEVRQRRYDSSDTIPKIPDCVELTDEKCSFIKTKNDELKERNNGIDTKARTLLTLTSLILGLASSTTGIASAKFVGIWAIVPLVFLFLTIFLLTVYFGIDTNHVVDYGYLQSKEASAKKTLYNDILKCQYYNELVGCFLLDLYRSALRYFTVGMLCIMALGIWNIVVTNSNIQNYYDDFKSFPTHINLQSNKIPPIKSKKIRNIEQGNIADSNEIKKVFIENHTNEQNNGSKLSNLDK